MEFENGGNWDGSLLHIKYLCPPLKIPVNATRITKPNRIKYNICVN